MNRSIVLVALVALAIAVPVALPSDSTNDHLDTTPAATSEPDSGAAPVVLPDADAWREAARTGAALEVPLAHGPVAVTVAPVTLWSGTLDARDVHGASAATDAIVPLDGRIHDDDAALVRITVSGERVSGIIHSDVHGDHEVATGSDGAVRAYPDALVRTLPGIGGAIDDDHQAPAVGASLAASKSAADGGPDCLSLVPEPADATGLVSGWSTRILDVAFPVDTHYTVSHADWVGDVVAAANTLDGLYTRDFDIRIQVVHIIVIPASAIPGPGSSDYLTQTAAYYAAEYDTLARDAVYLGVANPDHSFGGQAECIGGAGFPAEAYGVGTTDSNAPYSFTGYETLLPGKQYKIAAHEIGHLLTAHHHHANCIESIPGYDPFITLDVCTVMINDWGLIQPVFSTLNRLVMRGHADQQDL